MEFEDFLVQLELSMALDLSTKMGRRMVELADQIEESGLGEVMVGSATKRLAINNILKDSVEKSDFKMIAFLTQEIKRETAFHHNVLTYIGEEL